MKLDNITSNSEKFSNYDKWLKEMKARGVTELLQELEFNTDLKYAVDGTKLIGTWSPKKKEGIRYSNKGMNFDKRRRAFKKEKI